MASMLGIALVLIAGPAAAQGETGTTAGPVVLFVQGSTGQETERALLVPVVCYKPDIGLVSAATSDCLSLVPKDAKVCCGCKKELRDRCGP